MTSQRGFTPILIIVGILIIATVAGGAYYLRKDTSSLRGGSEATDVAISPTPTPTPDETVYTESDETANWKTYTNTEYGYSIKYSQNFKTQVQAAGAGVKEAPDNAINLYIYNPDLEESYLNRYINVEIFNLEPSLSNEWEQSEVLIGNTKATKYTNSTSQFDVYHMKLPNNQGVIEMQVSNSSDKKGANDQILSTFKFLP